MQGCKLSPRGAGINRCDRRCPGQQSRRCLLTQRVSVLQRGLCSAHAKQGGAGGWHGGMEDSSEVLRLQVTTVPIVLWAAHTQVPAAVAAAFAQPLLSVNTSRSRRLEEVFPHPPACYPTPRPWAILGRQRCNVGSSTQRSLHKPTMWP